MPTVRAIVGQDFRSYGATDNPHEIYPDRWYKESSGAVYLRPDGDIEFSCPISIPGRVFSEMRCRDGFRVFVNIESLITSEGGYVSFRRITEADYQRLLEKRTKFV